MKYLLLRDIYPKYGIKLLLINQKNLNLEKFQIFEFWLCSTEKKILKRK